MTWLKRFTYLAFLYTFFEYQGATGTKGTCVCPDEHGNPVYNLAPLQSTDEYNPRFTIRGGKLMPDYMYGYNPCTSFIKRAPPGKQSYCLNDVAICEWTVNGGIPLNIGIQSTAKCGTDIVTGRPQLIYQSIYAEPQWSTTVTLICNRTKKTEKDATFVQNPNNAWNFFLTHICACAGGCQLDPVTNKPTPGTTKPTPGTTKPTPGSTKPIHVAASYRDADSPWKDIWEPVTIAAGTVVFVFIVIIVIRLLLKTQNIPKDAGERRRLIDEKDSGIN